MSAILKNFAAVCLAGIIILVLLVSLPHRAGRAQRGERRARRWSTPSSEACSYALQYLAMCVLLILSLVKSGAWARDILGGLIRHGTPRRAAPMSRQKTGRHRGAHGISAFTNDHCAIEAKETLWQK